MIRNLQYRIISPTRMEYDVLSQKNMDFIRDNGLTRNLSSVLLPVGDYNAYIGTNAVQREPVLYLTDIGCYASIGYAIRYCGDGYLGKEQFLLNGDVRFMPNNDQLSMKQLEDNITSGRYLSASANEYLAFTGRHIYCHDDYPRWNRTDNGPVIDHSDIVKFTDNIALSIHHQRVARHGDDVRGFVSIVHNRRSFKELKKGTYFIGVTDTEYKLALNEGLELFNGITNSTSEAVNATSQVAS